MKNGKWLGLTMVCVGMLGACSNVAEEVEITGDCPNPYAEEVSIYEEFKQYKGQERLDFAMSLTEEQHEELVNSIPKTREFCYELAEANGISREVSIEIGVCLPVQDEDDVVEIYEEPESDIEEEVDQLAGEVLPQEESEEYIREDLLTIYPEVYDYLDDPTMLTWPFTDRGDTVSVFVEYDVIIIYVGNTMEGYEWLGESYLVKGVQYEIHFTDGEVISNY